MLGWHEAGNRVPWSAVLVVEWIYLETYAIFPRRGQVWGLDPSVKQGVL